MHNFRVTTHNLRADFAQNMIVQGSLTLRFQLGLFIFP